MVLASKKKYYPERERNGKFVSFVYLLIMAKWLYLKVSLIPGKQTLLCLHLFLSTCMFSLIYFSFFCNLFPPVNLFMFFLYLKTQTNKHSKAIHFSRAIFFLQIFFLFFFSFYFNISFLIPYLWFTCQLSIGLLL